MLKQLLRCISTLLVLVLLINMMPVQALESLQAETTGEMDTALTGTSNNNEQASIIAEIPEGRTEFSKEFLLSNGLHLAAVYAEPIHYEKDGKWEDIDNTLTLHTDGTYRNSAGVWDVAFPQSFGNSQTVTITKDGYTLSFGMPQRITGLVSGGNVSVMSSENAELTQQAATVTAQVDATVDVSQAKADAEHPETVLEKLSSRMTYQSVHSGTNVVYDLSGSTVKESVVMASYDGALRGYRYILNAGSLIPVVQDDGSIHFYDKTQTEVVMTMESPFLMDNSGAVCEDIAVSLNGSGGKYVLTYTLPQNWLASEQRQWPVILDPVVSANTLKVNYDDVIIFTEIDPRYTRGYLDLGYEEGAGIKRTYLKYNELPALTSADYVVSATMTMWQMYNRPVVIPAEVHQVRGYWQEDTITWDTQPAFDETVVDFVLGKSKVEYKWDVTSIVKDWYVTGENHGFVFKTSEAVENAGVTQFRQFYSSSYGYDYRPALEIKFRNNNGLEDYWNYSSASAGRAGTGSVNNYSGNMVWTRSDMGFGGNRMPVAISHVYNTNDAGNNDYGMGYGWQSNYHQRVYKWTADIDGDGTVESNEFHYAWEDGDGTTHYFIKQSATVYTDEDKLGLTMNISGSGSSTTWTISDKGDTKRYFDTQGRLFKIENDQATKSNVQIAYTATDSNLISTVTDGAGRVYSFVYENDLLSQIRFLGKGTTPLYATAFEYDENENLETVTDNDGKQCSYSYDANHILTSAADTDGYQLLYTYHADGNAFAPARVASVSEMDNYNSNQVKGSRLTFSYGNNQTVLTSWYWENNAYQKENTLLMQFNNWGNPVSVQDEEGRAQHQNFGWEDDTTTAKGNQLSFTSKLQNTVTNRLSDHSFESGNPWTSLGTVTHSICATESYLGSKSQSLTGSGELLRSPGFPVENGSTYTFSAYVKTTAGKVQLGIGDADGTNALWSVAADTDGQWEHVQVSYTNDSGAAKTVYALLKSADNATAYIDCVQVEKMPTASRYNLVENSDFSLSTGWTPTGTETGDGITTVTAAAPPLDGSAYKMTGNYSGDKYISQNIAVSGTAGDSYVFTGWAMGQSAALTVFENGVTKDFGLKFTFHNTDDTTTDATVQFNTAVDGWQYAAASAVADKDYSSVTISVLYNKNANTVYFDGIQVYKEEFGTNYEYYDNGDLKSTTDLQKKKIEYVYDDDHNLTQIKEDEKVKVTYAYDNYHNVTSMVTETGQTYGYTYDTYGNNKKVTLSDGTGTVSSEAFYTTDGNQLDYTTDALGNETHYDYDTNTGVLQSVKNPNDSEETKTEYTYDSMFRMATAAADLYQGTADTGKDLSVSYTYNDRDLLGSIVTPSTTYSFEYGNFGLRTKVTIGGNTLVSYAYNARNQLTQQTYGNGDFVQFEYDDIGRVTKQTYEDGATVTYAYDNIGNLATVTDSATGIVTTYYYDLLNRQVGYWKKSETLDHRVIYGYNEDNNVSSITETVNGTTKTYSYTYDDDNRLISENADGITVTYTYDDLGRLTQKQTKNGDTVIKTDSYTFTASTVGTNGTSSQVASYNGLSYTYDDNGNILSVSDGTNTTTYQYDSANQLVRENNQAQNFTKVWTYDNAGNILSRSEYAYTTGDLGTATETVTYQYTSAKWGDMLRVYDGQNLTYDASGNLANDGKYTYTWEHGRQLARITAANGAQMLMTYGADGLRTGRVKTNSSGATLATYTYVYDGGKLSQMTYGNYVVDITYDAAGTPLTMVINGQTTYHYVTNLQGDVIALTDDTGAEVITYSYDAWGNVISYTGTYATLNPLLYRGYVYDWEIHLYYLQSRYYNPEWGRFISADSQLNSDSLLSYNQFAYCENNPIMYSDPCGTCIHRWYLLGLVDCDACKAKKIKYDVPLYNQGNSNLCWAYSQMMIEDYNTDTNRSKQNANERAKEIAIEKHGADNWNRGGRPTIRTEISISNIEQLHSALQEYGPLYVSYGKYVDGNRESGHAVVVTGVNLINGRVYTNNPHGIRGRQKYEDFIQVFTGTDEEGWRLDCYFILQ